METLLALVAAPAAVYGLIVLLVLWPRMTRVRYRVGQEWNFAPVLWVANPAHVNTSETSVEDDASTREQGTNTTVGGGARGNW